MGVKRGQPELVTDLDGAAITVLPTRLCHHAIGGGMDAGAIGAREINPLVPPPAGPLGIIAPAETV